MTSEPFQTAKNGRTSTGQFGPGNQCAKGHSSKGKQLRAALLTALEVKDVYAVVLTVLEKALDGDLQACKLLLSVIGPPTESDMPTTPEINHENFEEVKNAWLAKCN